jgi:hypothetical protein
MKLMDRQPLHWVSFNSFYEKNALKKEDKNTVLSTMHSVSSVRPRCSIYNGVKINHVCVYIYIYVCMCARMCVFAGWENLSHASSVL